MTDKLYNSSAVPEEENGEEKKKEQANRQINKYLIVSAVKLLESFLILF